MLKLKQNIGSPVLLEYTHTCGNTQYIMGHRKYCLWCSETLPNVSKLLVSLEHRIEFNKEGKIDNAKP